MYHILDVLLLHYSLIPSLTSLSPNFLPPCVPEAEMSPPKVMQSLHLQIDDLSCLKIVTSEGRPQGPAEVVGTRRRRRRGCGENTKILLL